jgi:hypothetical protein
VLSIGEKFACWSLFQYSITPACLAGALAKADTPTLQNKSNYRQSPSRGEPPFTIVECFLLFPLLKHDEKMS